MNEVSYLREIVASGAEFEKLGIVALLFIVCVILALLLRKSVSDKREVLSALDSYKGHLESVLIKDIDTRTRLYEQHVEIMVGIRQSIDELKTLTKTQQELIITILKVNSHNSKGEK